MLVVDASCLFKVVADTPRAGAVAARLAADVDQAAPHVIDLEVMGVGLATERIWLFRDRRLAAAYE
jgi:predicted nucleic acid-binding protein